MRFLLISGRPTQPSSIPASSRAWPLAQNQPPSVVAHDTIPVISDSEGGQAGRMTKQTTTISSESRYIFPCFQLVGYLSTSPALFSNPVSTRETELSRVLLPYLRLSLPAGQPIILPQDCERESQQGAGDIPSSVTLVSRGRRDGEGCPDSVSARGGNCGHARPSDALSPRFRSVLGGEGGVDLTGLKSRVLLEGKSVLRHFELNPPPSCRLTRGRGWLETARTPNAIPPHARSFPGLCPRGFFILVNSPFHLFCLFFLPSKRRRNCLRETVGPLGRRFSTMLVRRVS